MKNVQNKQNMQNMQNISPLFFLLKDQKSKISESDSSINSRTCLGHLVLFLQLYNAASKVSFILISKVFPQDVERRSSLTPKGPPENIYYCDQFLRNTPNNILLPSTYLFYIYHAFYTYIIPDLNVTFLSLHYQFFMIGLCLYLGNILCSVSPIKPGTFLTCFLNSWRK